MSYHNLSNAEIVFLFLVSKSIRDQYETAYNQKSIEQTIPTDYGVVKLETPLPSEMIETLMKSRHYLFMKDINDKLHPLYILIQEAEPEVVEDVQSIFNHQKE